ncbi:MAG: hypothetical protein Q7J30_01740 [Candidatus Azambacteria bacterium]|nr:hypothetical protein [Candidatus Azambacteria bacterium]
MVVKFIVTTGGIVFGNKSYRDDFHAEVAKRNDIPRTAVLGGGLADLTGRRIFGMSYGFGPYDSGVVRSLLPDWQIAEPSDY